MRPSPSAARALSEAILKAALARGATMLAPLQSCTGPYMGLWRHVFARMEKASPEMIARNNCKIYQIMLLVAQSNQNKGVRIA